MQDHKKLEVQTNEDVTPSIHEPIDRQRLAKLVAAGEVPFPGDLSRADANRLALEVSRFRQARLIRYIAREIARDIDCSKNPKQGS